MTLAERRHAHALVWLLAALYAASQLNLALMLAPLRPNLFALQLAFTPEAFWQVLDAWGADGVERYRAHFRYDNVHPFIYAAFGRTLVSRTELFATRAPTWRPALSWMLPVAALCDLMENAAHLYLLEQAHGIGIGIGVVPFAATCSSIKWLLAAIYSMAVVMACGRLIVGNGK